MLKMLDLSRRLRFGVPHQGEWKVLRIPHPMLTIVLAGLISTPVESVRAQWSDDIQRQAQCELSYIRDTRSRLAINWIRTACNRISIDTGLLDESNRKFHFCLLEHLSGAQNDAAANQIINACRTAYPP